ncbi:acyltransferase family protein [Denitromonas halophila]|uniref:Acyltransferase n=1 Tax=Denitromonas halophila TaxID=1629404 RepID=A0A557R3A7_9RHOO|nr:acyltransferase [Denitromonas halophila]TVO59649.1 acyltransferase [Denitromonas halophila]
MFGTYRTLLALAVLFQHLAGVPLIGHFAVYGFFVLSGYLMTAIMHKTYGYSLQGRFAYLVNRFLRLFPTYWLICLLTIGLILFYGEAATRAYHSAIFLPRELADIIANASLIFPATSPKWVEPRLAPPTWALTLEIVFYVLIGLGVSRSRRTTLAWLAVGAGYVGATFALELGHESRYSYIPAASLPFSIGALLFHYKTQTARIAAAVPGHALAWLPLYLLLAFLAQSNNRALIEPVFFANIALHALIITKLRDMPRSGWLTQADKLIGDLSYPIYLGHYQAGFIVTIVFWGSPLREGSNASMLAAALAAALAVATAYLINRILDSRIEALRRALKRHAPVTS